MKTTGSIAALLSLAASQPALSQNAPPALQIIVEEMGSDAAQCGILKDTTIATMRASLRYNRIQEENLPLTPKIYISGNVIRSPDGLCFGSYDVDIFSYQLFDVTGFSRKMLGKALYCSVGGVVSNYRDISIRYYENLRRSFEECLSTMVEKTNL